MKEPTIMKKIILFIICLFSYRLEAEIQIPYIMRLNFKQGIESKQRLPNVFGYYKGQRICFDKDFCSFKDIKTPNFLLLITPQVRKNISNYNRTSLERLPDNNCKLFYLNKTETSWIIEEENLNDIPIRIPDSAFVLLLDPKYIEKIEENFIHKDSQNLLYLPDIYIKNTQSLIEESDYIALDSLDISSIHTAKQKLQIFQNSSFILLQETI